MNLVLKHGKNGIEITEDDNSSLWLNEKHMEEVLDLTNVTVIANNMTQIIKNTDLNQQINEIINQRFLYNDLALKVIIDSRTNESCNFKRKLQFNPIDITNTEKQRILKAIKDAFE